MCTKTSAGDDHEAQKYDLEVQYEKGKNMHIADFLSRAYLPNTEHPTGANFEHVNMAAFLPISDQQLQEIRKETEKDETLQDPQVRNPARLAV